MSGKTIFPGEEIWTPGKGRGALHASCGLPPVVEAPQDRVIPLISSSGESGHVCSQVKGYVDDTHTSDLWSAEGRRG